MLGTPDRSYVPHVCAVVQVKSKGILLAVSKKRRELTHSDKTSVPMMQYYARTRAARALFIGFRPVERLISISAVSPKERQVYS